MKPSRPLKSSPPQFIATPGELSFQEGRPLPPSDDEDEGQVVRNAKHFIPNQEILMIHIDEDFEGLERVQLDGYHDYLLDPLDDVDVTMDSVSPANIKVGDADDIQNAVGSSMRSVPNAGTVRSRETSRGAATSTTPPRATFTPSSMLAETPAMSFIAKQQEREEAEVYSSTHHQLSLNYLETTWKRKPEAREQSTHRKKTLSSKERFEVALHGQCPWHPKTKHSVFECQTFRRALGALPKL
jgi:hypothetical protein